IVAPDSAATSISQIVNSPVIGFQLNHADIAKPASAQSPVYLWAMNLIKGEYIRVSTWDAAHNASPPAYRLCERVPLIPECWIPIISPQRPGAPPNPIFGLSGPFDLPQARLWVPHPFPSFGKGWEEECFNPYT